MQLDHISYSNLSIMVNKSIFKEFPQLDVRTKIVSEGCQYRKAYQLPCKESKFRVNEQLELMEYGIW